MPYKIGRKLIALLVTALSLSLLMACGENTPLPTPLPATVTPTLPVNTATALPIPSPTIATTAAATPTLIPSKTLAPFQPIQKQVGAANCCQAFGVATDGRLYYYDKPAGETRPATFTLELGSGQPQHLNNSFGNFSPDLSLIAIPDSLNTVVEQVKDGKKLATLANRGSPLVFSPDNTQLAYLLRATAQAGPEAPQSFELWVGKTDGTSLRSVWSLKEGANLAWFPDNRHLLLTARDAANQRFGLWVVDTSGQGAASLIVESKGLTVASFSAEGARVAYAVSGQGEANSGIWSALADGSNREKLSWLGSWRWSWLEPERLYYLPVGENALWSYDFTNGKATRMTDPATMPLKVAGNEWVLLPADKGLVYRNASDNSLWWLQLNR